MKKVLLLAAFVTLGVTAQSNLPVGWDKVMMDDKPAYMNINTGEITRTYPKGVARRVPSASTQSYTSASSYASKAGSHTVQRGETLSKIARSNNMSLREVYDLNPSINFNKLAIGQIINVRGNSSVSGSGKSHTVKTGETLYRIASNYGISVSELKSLNNLSSNEIRIGQRLKVN